MRKLVLLFSLLLTACTPKPKPIDYGADMCDFCRMTVVDRQHAAELVSQKGKDFKFDAIECMVQYLKQHSSETYAYYLVNDYLQDGELVDAKACTFLISPNIPSPMGAFLSAFKDPQEAQNWLAEKSGDLYSWEELQDQIK